MKLFQGKVIVFTGSLACMTRSEAKAAVENLGGVVSPFVNKNVSFVVVAPGAGSKLVAAERLGIEIISEEQFIERMKPHGSHH